MLFGVSDDGNIVGQEVTAKTLEDIASELRKIEPPVFPEIEVVTIANGRAVIVIRVPGKIGTYCYGNRPYIRHGSTTQIMPREEYEKRILEKFHAHQRWENEYAPEWVNVEDLNKEEIQFTLRNAIELGRMKKPHYTDSESVLRGLGLIDDGKLINAAVALYGKSERLFSFYPQLSLRLARFRGENRLEGFKDNRDYWGNAFDLLKRSEQFLLDHVPISGRVVPGKMIREDYPMFPPLGIREAVANAICHRDYTTPGGAVAIAMYDDRLEVINPGTFHFDITPKKLSQPHESKPWNPIIASVLYRAGVIEKWGTGTLNIIEWCKKNKNPEPKWEIRAHSVVTTFYPSVVFAKDHRPESLEIEVLNLLKEKAYSKAEISQAIGHKGVSGGLKKVLQQLLEKGQIVPTIPEKPNSRLQKYQRPESRPGSLEIEILHLLKRESLSKTEIAQKLGHKHISGGLKSVLAQLLKKEQIAFTIPEKPNSRLQKYQLKSE